MCKHLCDVVRPTTTQHRTSHQTQHRTSHIAVVRKHLCEQNATNAQWKYSDDASTQRGGETSAKNNGSAKRKKGFAPMHGQQAFNGWIAELRNLNNELE